MTQPLQWDESRGKAVEMKPLSITPIHTSLFHPGQALADFVVKSIPTSVLHEGVIIAVTSKIVSLAENRLVPKSEIEKPDLIAREADYNLGPIGYGSILTVKESLLIASAGIDESNSETGHYILYPEKPFESARRLHQVLRERWNLSRVGVILTDSRTSPLRFGVTGVSLAYWGFKGLQDKVGSNDLFGRPMQMTKINFADGLAAAATLVMGEGDESRPLAVIAGADVEFCDSIDPLELRVPLEEDLFYPLFKSHIR